MFAKAEIDPGAKMVVLKIPAHIDHTLFDLADGYARLLRVFKRCLPTIAEFNGPAHSGIR